MDVKKLKIGGHRAKSLVATVLVDASDHEYLSQYAWSASHKRHGLAAVRRARQPDCSYRMVLMHREIMGLGPGDPRQVDHRNGNTLDNRRSNLRVLTNAQNGQNRRGPHRRRSKSGKVQRTSKHRGVVFNPKYRLPWQAIMRFPTEEEAGAAMEEHRAKYMPYADPAYDPPT